jgi:predicted DCC family thiol-disulfide oxidoreductase YuxK
VDGSGKGSKLEVPPEVARRLEAPARPRRATVVFYDGVCGLCNRLNRFLLARDLDGRILFAPLQSEVAREVLARHGADPSGLDTVWVIADWQSSEERALPRSRGVLHALAQLPGKWPFVARVGAAVPRPLAELAYRLVARQRYRLFGKFDSCQLPPPEWRSRFLDR